MFFRSKITGDTLKILTALFNNLFHFPNDWLKYHFYDPGFEVDFFLSFYSGMHKRS